MPNVPLEQIDYKKAIKEYKPSLVICSWIPEDEDFTEFIRNQQFINEYILIGDPDRYGHFEKTWGGREFLNLIGKSFLSTDDPNISNELKNRIKTLPFYKDGFDAYELKRLENYQIDHSTYFYTKPLDNSEWKYSNARTISFRRRQK